MAVEGLIWAEAALAGQSRPCVNTPTSAYLRSKRDRRAGPRPVAITNASGSRRPLCRARSLAAASAISADKGSTVSCSEQNRRTSANALRPDRAGCTSTRA